MLNGQLFLAEFIGTFILIYLGCGVNANILLKDSKGNGGGWIVIAAGWAMAVAMAVYTVGRVSGAHINPARDFGPRLAHALLPIPGKGSNDWGYSWIPILGPFAGGVCGAQLFQFSGL